MNKTYYVCKYTPIELLTALGAECENLNGMQEGFDRADQLAHSNICGFGKSLLEAVMSGQVHELVLVNCCDTIRSVYDVLEESGKLDFLYLVDMLHSGGECSRQRTAAQLKGLAKAYAAYKGTTFDAKAFRAAFHAPEKRPAGRTSACWAPGWARNCLRWCRTPCLSLWRMKPAYTTGRWVRYCRRRMPTLTP